MSVIHLWAVLTGLAIGSGILLLITGLPVLNRTCLAERVAPYLRSTTSQRLSSQQSPRSLSVVPAAQALAPVREAAAQMFRRIGLLPSTESLNYRLRQANLRITPAEYRVQQLGWAVAAALLAVALNALTAVAGRFNPVAAVLVISAAAVLGAAARNQRLSARINARRQRMLTEFPTIAELLALAVSAGEAVPAAFHRISRSCRGEIAEELDVLMGRVRAGTPFTKALRDLSVEIGAPAVARFFEGVIIAVERGTPLAEVMHAQAADARDLTKRGLMEAAGRKETAMLAPVIFGVLPLTVVFAAFPGLALLQIGL